MSSSGDEPEMMRWFRQNYPVESSLANKIARDTNPIFARITSNLAEGQQLPIYLAVQKTHNGFQLIVNDIGVVFLGSFAKSIVDSILENLPESRGLNEAIEKKAKEVTKQYMTHIIPSITLQNFRKCPSCGLDNDYNAKYCKECGTKLPEL